MKIFLFTLIAFANLVLAQDSLNVSRVGAIYGWDYASRVDVVDTLAYVATGSTGLRILNIANPQNPTEFGFYDTPGYAYDVAISGDYAYVADYNGLRIINISSPRNPVQVGSLTLPNGVRQVMVLGNYTYLRANNSLIIVNITDPLQPAQVGFYQLSGFADMAVTENYAYLLGSDSLQVIDVSNPTNPVRIGHYVIGAPISYNSDITLSDNYAYLTSFNEFGLRIIDISNPTSPQEVGEYIPTIPSGYFRGHNVTINGVHAYLSITTVSQQYDTTDFLKIIDVADPVNPVEVNSLEGSMISSLGNCDILGNYAYATVQNYFPPLNDFAVYDLSNPIAPMLISSFNPLPTDFHRVAISGSYAYVANEDGGGIYSIDISNPAEPVLAGSHPTIDWAMDIKISGNYAYVADWFVGPIVFDISDPTDLQTVAWITSIQGVYTLAISENYLYAAKVSGLYVMDITDPLHAVLVGHDQRWGDCYGLAVRGNYVYMADGGLRIMNVADPTHPTQVSFLDMSGPANDVVIQGNYAYVANDSRGLRIINIINPINPFEEGFFDTQGSAYGVTVSGSFAFVSDGNNGLRVINISDPSAPVEAGYYNTAGSAKGAAIMGNYVYVADESDFSILNCSLTGGVYFAPYAFNFGNVFMDSLATDTLRIYNWDANPLFVNGIQSGDPQFHVNDLQTVIAPQDSLAISITYTPSDTLYHHSVVNITTNFGVYSIDCRGHGVLATGISAPSSLVPQTFALHQNFPNPFNPTTEISFDLPKASNASLKVYNTAGQEVVELVKGNLSAGTHKIIFDASHLASGLYFYQLQTATLTATKKMVVIK